MLGTEGLEQIARAGEKVDNEERRHLPQVSATQCPFEDPAPSWGPELAILGSPMDTAASDLGCWGKASSARSSTTFIAFASSCLTTSVRRDFLNSHVKNIFSLGPPSGEGKTNRPGYTMGQRSRSSSSP